MSTPWNQTKRSVVGLIRRQGAVSRIQLASHLRLTKAAMTQVVQDLLDEGVLVSAGAVSAPSGRGRPQEQLKLGQGGPYGIGMTIKVDYQVELVLVDATNRVIARREMLTKPSSRYENPMQFARAMAREITLLSAKARGGWVTGVGVAVSGSRSADGQTMEFSHDFGTTAEANEFLGELRRLVPLPVNLWSGVSSAVLAERWLDDQLPASPRLLYINDQLNTGLLLDGRLHVGMTGSPQWMGHFQIDPNGPKCFCGRRGCLTIKASLFAHTDKLSGHEFGKRPLVTATRSCEDLQDLVHRYEKGDPRVRRMVAEAFEWLGLGLRSLASTFSLDLIVLGAWVGITPDRELERVQRLVDEGYYGELRTPRQKPRVRWSSQGRSQEPYGAAILQIDHALDSLPVV